ncbi:hypothetical protein PsAD2_02422 [Pseudovibrio axinellae]|uniref:Dihydroorotate dehydrogenase n=1 Tax=Pseudovibrio axinellae TaxID=989403 RepID=A0A165YJX4_9HYPH|nr:DUF952 domain-containing protein [Pseudovibrio axinellae]KZL18906.1 hypothetical protein PsAD2_02422 [Pseudovibrio axinellae]SEP88217.1 Uncharacterized conserved protein, DUF952 family [Pseudovibrio axinellae]
MSLIYKIAPQALWQQAEAAGIFTGAPIDLADGYIHFSSAQTVKETAALYFAGQTDLLLIAVESEDFPQDEMKWEASRGGTLFPHLYGKFAISKARWVKPLPLNADGNHMFPEL